MELTFTRWRVAILVFLMIGFALIGGFEIPEGMPRHATRAWALTILGFTASAISTTVVDHWIGNLDRSNLRWFYIVIGVCGMAAAMAFRHALKSA